MNEERQVLGHSELYKKDTRGKVRVFSIRWGADWIETGWGVHGGEVQFQEESVSHGKQNRSVLEQVLSRVNSIISKKLDKGYVHDIAEAKAAKMAVNALGLPKPMLAQPYKNIKSLDFDNLMWQFKYNGHRCLITNQGGDKIAYSRNGKVITTIGHIIDELDIPEGTTLDGELYIHGESLQKITSYVKKLQDDSKRLIYVLYDVVSPAFYLERYAAIAPYSGLSYTIVAPTQPLHFSDNVALILSQAVSSGFEGLVLRPTGYGYETGKRSRGLIKVKQFMDDEFLVVNVEKSAEGWGILNCVTPDGKAFSVSAPGTIQEKQEVAHNPSHYIGKFVRVTFADWTDDDIPFHPVAEMFRNKSGE